MKKEFLSLIILSVFWVVNSSGLICQETQQLFHDESQSVAANSSIEPVGENAGVFTEFKTIAPNIGREPTEKTVVRASYDETHLHFVIQCFDSSPEHIKSTITKRDNIENDDWIGIELDVRRDGRSNYLFMVNPHGIQADGFVDTEGNDDFSFDTVWESSGQITTEGYTINVAIPYKSIRFAYGEEVRIGIGIRRNISRKSEVVCFPEFDPAKGSRLVQRQEFVLHNIEYDRPFEIIPAYTRIRTDRNSSGEWNRTADDHDLSLTGKVGVTPQMALDFTYNPDFSQIESDVGQIDANLRVALFYPEKRPFFMEGSEHLSFSASRAYREPVKRAVNTRNINDPLLGIKLSGSIGQNNTLYSLISLDELPDDYENRRKTASVARYKRSTKDDGYLGAYYTGIDEKNRYNRVFGSDAVFRLNGNSTLEYHLFSSFTKSPGKRKTANGTALGLKYGYLSEKREFWIRYFDVSPDFQSDLGYIQRTGLRMMNILYYHNLYPESGIVKKISVVLNPQHSYDIESDMFERYEYFGLEFTLPRNTWIWIGTNPWYSEIYLKKRFSRTVTAGGGRSQLFKSIFMNFNFEKGDFIYYSDDPFQGWGYSGKIDLLFQPTSRFSSSIGYSYQDFYRDSDEETMYVYKIFRNRTVFQFNRYLFLRSITEYNTFRETVTADILASFTYIPGTVIQLGYGSRYDRETPHTRKLPFSDRYRQNSESFFFKMSYLWRM